MVREAPLQGAHRLASLCRLAGLTQCAKKPRLNPYADLSCRNAGL
jgi:hypothetical protein